MNDFSDLMASRLVAAGLSGANLECASPELASNFGDTEATFSIEGLLLRFTKDRAQIFLGIASIHRNNFFYQFADIEIAMGWKTLDQVLTMQDPDDIDHVLQQVKLSLIPLSDGLSNDLTRARINRAAQTRGRLFVDGLRGDR